MIPSTILTRSNSAGRFTPYLPSAPVPLDLTSAPRR